MLRLYSTELPFEAEFETLERMLGEGLQRYHLRRPSWTAEEQAVCLEQLTAAQRQIIILHQFHEQALDFACKGVHLKSIDRQVLNEDEILAFIDRYQDVEIGTGIHQLEELGNLQQAWTYITASPIFSSISKPGHHPTELWDIVAVHKDARLVGLGGISPMNMMEARFMGFKSVAVLGAVWQSKARAVLNLRELLSVWKQLEKMY